MVNRPISTTENNVETAWWPFLANIQKMQI